MRATKRIALAAAVVLTLLVGFAAPAPAIGGDILSGRLTTVLANFDLTPGSQGTPPCNPPKPDTIAFTTTATRWNMGGTFSGQFQLPPGSGNWYQADFQILGVVSGTPPTAGGTWTNVSPGTQRLDGTIIIRVTITQVQINGGPIDCSKTNVRCIANSAITLNVPQTPPQPDSTYKSLGAGGTGPGLPTTQAGDLVTLSGEGLVTTSMCAPPFSALHNTLVQLKDLQAIAV